MWACRVERVNPTIELGWGKPGNGKPVEGGAIAVASEETLRRLGCVSRPCLGLARRDRSEAIGQKRLSRILNRVLNR